MKDQWIGSQTSGQVSEASRLGKGRKGETKEGDSRSTFKTSGPDHTAQRHPHTPLGIGLPKTIAAGGLGSLAQHSTRPTSPAARTGSSARWLPSMHLPPAMVPRDGRRLVSGGCAMPGGFKISLPVLDCGEVPEPIMHGRASDVEASRDPETDC